MKNFALVQRACALAVALVVGVFNADVALLAQEKKEELGNNAPADSSQKQELRYYVNYGYRGSNPSAVNAEFSKFGLPGLPDGMFDISAGYKRFYPSNWMFGFDFGVSLGFNRNQQYSTSVISIYDRIWGGYRFVNTDAVKVYAAAALEPNFTFTTTTKNRTVSFGSYLANPAENASGVNLLIPQINIPFMLNAEIKLPNWFNEPTNTWLGLYAGYTINAFGNLPVQGRDGAQFSDAPKQPGGGFMAGVSLSFDWGQFFKKQMETLSQGSEKK